MITSASIRKVSTFSILGGIGAFIGSWLGYHIGGQATVTELVPAILKIGSWDALIAIGIGIAFVLAQNWYLKRSQTDYRSLFKIGTVCAIAGFAGGAALVLMRRQFTGLDSATSLTLAWGVEGLVIGFLIAPVIPNLPRKPALIAGGIAGTLGAVSMIMLQALQFDSALSVAIGDSLKGLFLGLTLTVTETLCREAWLEVCYGPGECRTVSLGETPVSVGNHPDCTVYVHHPSPIVLKYRLTQGQLLCDDPQVAKIRALQAGDRQMIGNVSIIVHTVNTSLSPAKHLALPAEHSGSTHLPVAFSLYLNRRTIPLVEGKCLQTREIPGLVSQSADQIVAEVCRNPQSPLMLGLKNRSPKTWRVTLATGEQKMVEPGRTVKLATGTRINFGDLEAEIRA